MAYETKVILASLSRNIAKSKTVEEAYEEVVAIASVEGLKLPPIEEVRNGKKGE
jgi:hypothetical protein